MTNLESISEYITATFLLENGQDSIEPDDNLLLSGLIDSLGVMQLVAHLQAENGIKIEPREVTLKNFKTINSIVGFVENKINA